MNYVRLGLALGLGLLVLHIEAADIFILKNGKRLEGKVIETTDDGLILETRQGQVLISEADIDRRIEGAGATEEMHAAEDALTGDRYLESLRLFLDALPAVTTKEQRDRVKQGIHRAVKNWLDDVERRGVEGAGSQIQVEDMAVLNQTERQLDDADLLERFRTYFRDMEEKAVSNLLDRARSAAKQKRYPEAEKAYEDYLKRWSKNNAQRIGARAELADLEADWAEENMGLSDFAQAENHATKAIEGNSDLIRAYLLRAHARVKLRQRLDEAEQDLRKVYSVRDTLSDIDLRAYRGTVRELQKARSRPTYAPIPTRRPSAGPPPTPGPTPSLSERATRWFKGVRYQVTSGNWTKAIKNNLWNMGIVVGVFVVYWVIPYSYVKRLTRRRQVVTAAWQRVIFWMGLLGLIAFLLMSLVGRKKIQRCHACKGNLSNINMYDDYDFDHCPHCGKQIKPVFNLPDFIMTSAKVLIRRRQFETEGGWDNMMEILNMTFLHAGRSRASDIHFEPEEDRLLARFRIDGILYDSLTMPREISAPVISAIKGRASLDIAEKRMPQDGHFSARMDGNDVNVRVSTLPTRMGEKAVLRLLDRRNIGMHLLEMGFPESMANRFMDNVFAPHGIILSSGPTGSGKTTLLYSALQQLNDGSRNIVTIEDPIEYEIPGINQTQHNTATGLTFATALRSILRQDPDTIMVGEIRDSETASIAVNAALTGHMVLSTVHTIDAPNAIARLSDMEVDVKQLASAVLCIVAQRLVRKLCTECRKPQRASKDDVIHLGGASVIEPGAEIFEAKGCSHCIQTGYRGRTGLFEVLFVTDEIRNLIVDGESVIRVRDAARAAGMSTLREQGVLKIADGVTSVEEVLRVTQDMDVQATQR